MNDKAQPDHTDAREKLHARIDNDFTYHPPTPDQVTAYNQIREEARMFAHTLVDFVPPGRELSSALTSLETAVMQANAGIARQT